MSDVLKFKNFTFNVQDYNSTSAFKFNDSNFKVRYGAISGIFEIYYEDENYYNNVPLCTLESSKYPSNLGMRIKYYKFVLNSVDKKLSEFQKIGPENVLKCLGFLQTTDYFEIQNEWHEFFLQD